MERRVLKNKYGFYVLVDEEGNELELYRVEHYLQGKEVPEWLKESELYDDLLKRAEEKKRAQEEFEKEIERRFALGAKQKKVLDEALEKGCKTVVKLELKFGKAVVKEGAFRLSATAAERYADDYELVDVLEDLEAEVVDGRDEDGVELVKGLFLSKEVSRQVRKELEERNYHFDRFVRVFEEKFGILLRSCDPVEGRYYAEYYSKFLDLDNPVLHNEQGKLYRYWTENEWKRFVAMME